MGGAEELTVVVGAPFGAGSLPKSGLLLLVEADQEQARQLGQELAWDARVMVCSEVLTTEEGASVSWHRFNDARLNGPAGLEAWKEQYPNLQLVGEEQRRGRCLAGLLNAWGQQQGLQTQPWLHLEVRQGDPIAAVGGLGPWLAGLQSVNLDITKTAAQWHQPLDAWLRERGLIGVADAPGWWRRDPFATLQLSLQEKARRLGELEDLRSQLDNQMADKKKLVLAVEHIFLCDKYRAVRPDLCELGDRDLVTHFVERGINEAGKDLMAREVIGDYIKKLEENVELLAAENTLLLIERDEIATCLRNLRLNRETSLAANKKTKEPDSKKYSQESRDDLLSCHLEATTNAADKWESYFGHYNRNLSRFRNREKAVRLLEIGVQNGGSLEAWKTFLGEKSVVIGTDVDSACSLVESPFSVQCFTGDATDAIWAQQLCKAKGPFDIVIDDGSHINSDIEKTFALFFSSILPGGLYVCEDLHTAYWGKFGGCQPSKKENVMEMFKEIADLVNLEHWQKNANSNLSVQIPRLCRAKELSPALTIETLMTIESIEFCNSMVFIRKCGSGMNSLGQRIVSQGYALVDENVLDANGQRVQAMLYS